MRVCITCQWRVEKKETLGLLLRRVFDVGRAAGLGAPAIEFAATPGFFGRTNTIDRIVKRFPELATLRVAMPGAGPLASPVPEAAVAGVPAGEALMTRHLAPSPFTEELLLALADGVPRSFALQNVDVALRWPEFGEHAATQTGMLINDMTWGSGGRKRLLMGVALVDVDPGARAIELPARVTAMFNAFGKPVSRTQQPLMAPGTESAGPPPGFDEVFARHRAAMVARVPTLPHVVEVDGRSEPSGPKKPALAAAFKPMGYDCRGGSGEFTLSRRTPGNLVVELTIDVGTWGNHYTGLMTIHAPGWKVAMKILVAEREGQVSVAGPEGWRKIVDNLAAQVAALDREFVPEVEALLGPAPAWHERSP